MFDIPPIQGSFGGRLLGFFDTERTWIQYVESHIANTNISRKASPMYPLKRLAYVTMTLIEKVEKN